MRKTVIVYLTLIVVLAFLLGALMWGGRPDLTAAERERARIQNEDLAKRLEAERPAHVLWAYGWRVVAVVSALGLALIGLRWLARRAAEIRPDKAGLFPVVCIKVGRVTALHDPNRAHTPVTLYAPEQLAGSVSVISVPSAGPALQERTTARAQAVQLAAAVHRHPPMLVSGKAQDRPLASEPPEQAGPAWVLPSRVPLSALTNGQAPSIHDLIIGLAVDDQGAPQVVKGDMGKLVHVAVGGSSGWGKSVFLRTLGYQLATSAEKPDLVLVDLEAVTFAPFAGSECLLYPVADTEADALAVFKALTDELDRRKELFKTFPGIEDLDGYNARAGEPLAPVVCMVDEATALLADKGVEGELRTLALRGRKFGLWLILGGQDWKATTLDTAIRNQLGARLHFKAMSASQSRVLLQDPGAKDLDVPGRALALIPGRGLIELQTPLVSTDRIRDRLSGGGPRFPLPGQVDGTEARVLELIEVGQSDTAIAQEVFGYKNARTVERVRVIREGVT